jgi:hypothetical protein
VVNTTVAFGWFLVVGSTLAVPAVLRSNGTGRRGVGLLAFVGFWLAYGLVSLEGTLSDPPIVTDALFVAGGVALVVGVALFATEWSSL